MNNILTDLFWRFPRPWSYIETDQKTVALDADGDEVFVTFAMDSVEVNSLIQLINQLEDS